MLNDPRGAARQLGHVPGERRLYELNRILATRSPAPEKALRFLERTGALAALLPGSTARERRRGLRLAGRMPRPSPAVARFLLLLPLGPVRAREILRRWKTPRREQQLADRLFVLARAIRARPRGAPSPRREVVEVARAVSPFLEEAVLFLSVFADARARRLARRVRALTTDRMRVARVLRPPRPVDLNEVADAVGVSSGPALGSALEALDLALAAGEVRSRTGALRLLARRGRTAPGRAAR